MSNHEITLELIKLIIRPNLLNSFDKANPNRTLEEHVEFMANTFNGIFSKLPPQEVGKNQPE
jgi:hypothetical protein